MKLRLEVELDYDEGMLHGTEAEAIRWFREDILQGRSEGSELFLWSNEIGDEVGRVSVLRFLE